MTSPAVYDASIEAPVVASRPSITSLFGSGKSGMRGARSRRVSEALKWRQAFQRSPIYVYDLSSGGQLRLQQIDNGELKDIGTGAVVWPAAHVLAKYLEKQYPIEKGGLSGLRVCDIGSGTGITGLVAASLGPSEVILTDQKQILFLLERNTQSIRETGADGSFAADRVSVDVYDWGATANHLNPPFDVVLVSDCVLPKLYPIEPLVAAVAALLGPSSKALFSYEHRPYPYFDPRFEFARIASQYGLVTRLVPLTQHDEIYSAEDIEIWEVSRLDASAPERLDEEGPACPDTGMCMLSWGSGREVVKAKLREVVVDIGQEVEGIGCHIWPAAVVLSRFVLENSLFDELPGVRDALASSDQRFLTSPGLPSGHEACAVTPVPLAIDLGAGCGLTSMALALRGFDVLAVDREKTCPLLRANILQFSKAAKQAGRNIGTIDVLPLDWGTDVPRGASEEGQSSRGATVLEVCDSQEAPAAPTNPRWRAFQDATRGRESLLVVLSECITSELTIQPLLGALEAIDPLLIIVANEARPAMDSFLAKCARKRAHKLGVEPGCREQGVIDLTQHLGWEELRVFRGAGVNEALIRLAVSVRS